MVLRARSSKVTACLPACLNLRTGHTDGCQDQASWWHEQPQLQAPAPAPARATFVAEGKGSIAGADEMRRLAIGKRKEKQINIDSRSQPSKSAVAPLVRCPSGAASTAARRTCQIHRPAQLACFALAITALCAPAWPVCSVPSLPVPARKTVGYDVIGCAGPATTAIWGREGELCKKKK